MRRRPPFVALASHIFNMSILEMSSILANLPYIFATASNSV